MEDFWIGPRSRDVDPHKAKQLATELEKQMSKSEKGEYDRPHVTDREAAIAAEAIRNQFNKQMPLKSDYKPKKGKKGKKQKKEKTRKPSVLDHHFYDKSTPANLRPGDVVLRRVRKNKKKAPKTQDAVYEIVTVSHYNGGVETDGYMHSPDRVTVVIRRWDGSSAVRTWETLPICTTEELNVLRPLNRDE